MVQKARAYTACVLAGLLWCCQGTSAADVMIRNVTVLSPEDGSVAVRSVAIRGERVVAVVEPEADGRIAVTQVIDGTGRYLMPGLWDLHTHLAFADEHAPPLLVTQGVTGVRDLGGELADLDSLRARILAGAVVGPRMLRAGPALNGAPNGPQHRVIDSPEAARTAVTDLHGRGVDFFKTHNATERAPYLALVEAAAEVGMEVVGHIPTSVSALEACEAGQGSIDHIVTIFEGEYMRRFSSEAEGLQHFDEWLEQEAPALAECMAAHDVLFVPTLRTYEVRAHRGALYDNPPPGWDYLTQATRQDFRENMVPRSIERLPMVIQLRESIVEIGQQFSALLHQLGVRIGTGSDLSTYGPVPGFAIHRELQLLVEGGLPEAAAIWAGVRGPGERIGADPFTGRIVEGAPADLVLLRRNPFDDITAVASVDAVVLRGEVLDRPALDGILNELASR